MKTILVVDDDQDVRESLSEVLGDEGYRVILARNGEEALDRLKCEEDAPALVLLDMMMPIMTGWELLEEIGENRLASLPVIAISAFERRGVTKGIRHFISKPFDYAHLMQLVREFCA